MKGLIRRIVNYIGERKSLNVEGLNARYDGQGGRRIIELVGGYKRHARVSEILSFF